MCDTILLITYSLNILDDVEVTYAFKLRWLPPNKDGVVFVRPEGNNLDFKTSRTYINLDNLFEGQKALSKLNLSRPSHYLCLRKIKVK